MKTGVEEIAEERQEQFEKHGYDMIHDQQHIDKQIAKQAQLLLSGYTGMKLRKKDNDHLQDWNLMNQTHGDKIHRLRVAGALIAAEIDRINHSGK